MFYKKTNLPNEGDLIICTVKKILPTSIFVTLDEYKDLEGMIHISEISPGRIRNIRDYVRENKVIVCKVLKIDIQRKQIDLSLRRVNLNAKLKKEDEYKQEQKSEKILELAANKLKISLEDLYQKTGYKIIEEYGSLNDAFQDILKNGEQVLRNLKIDNDIIKELTAIIKEKIKLPEIKIHSILVLKSSAEDGINIIKDTIKKGENFAKEKDYIVQFNYISAPKYRLTVTSNEYKSAEQQMEQIANLIISSIKKEGGEGEFLRYG
jgi:translation initiation factor 2 subunit 1